MALTPFGPLSGRIDTDGPTRLTLAGKFGRHTRAKLDGRPIDVHPTGRSATADIPKGRHDLVLDQPRPGCLDRRKFRFRLHHAKHARVVRVTVFVNKKRRLRRRGHNIRSVVIRRLPRRTFRVKIVTRQSNGTRSISVRTYRGCRKSKPKTRGKHRRHRAHAR